LEGENPLTDALTDKCRLRRAAWILALLLLLQIFPVSAADANLQEVNVPEIIGRSIKANENDWHAAPEYNNFEREEKNGHTRTKHVLMILGSSYNRLVAVDGKPLSPAQNAEEEKKLRETIAARQSESKSQRAKRIARYEQSRQSDHFMMEQLTSGFNFKLEGMRTLNNHEVYLLSATPRPGYVPPNKESKALTGMEGKLWIDKETFHWVKVEAQVIHPVSIVGFLAEVEPGTSFVLEQMPVASGVWLPTHFSVKSHAKILGLFSLKDQEDDTYFDYQKASTISSAE
jgi:hypothetical protein